ncbi:formyltetrahydrofolate deformylase [Parvularcula sp. LCG005]|uniref:formyltetrahydrofolate deformylase n=1 Tax=Parvularcula sp. LCG005 TaxID=3078805 RepID=UPI002943A7F4|nr:formyltetrahydrofolate deformylase [Parvularcula sp. LCG005]WOI53422.1 formyltetrahydrofolate deformylase [Parvularcula sp. LCG005]
MGNGHPILTLSCPDKRGIVATVSSFLTETGCNILQSAQFDDLTTGLFFMRVNFDREDNATLDELRAGFAPIARRLELNWHLHDASQPVRMLIMASKSDHCLVDLLHRIERGEINADVRGVVSNHLDGERIAEHYGVKFHHLPVTPETKTKQEAALRQLMQDEDVELIVLARYMQVLSADFCRDFEGRIINIHHSFLPSFKGARPYHRAFERGVKLIGATAHFVTADLDEGPIIEQEVARVDHAMTPDQLVEVGRDTERQTLARAVKFYVQRRILLNGIKTVVFR